jgi:hypothetical protein
MYVSVGIEESRINFGVCATASGLRGCRSGDENESRRKRCKIERLRDVRERIIRVLNAACPANCDYLRMRVQLAFRVVNDIAGVGVAAFRA